jgi:hypothetical protein
MHESKSDRSLKGSNRQAYTWFGDIDQPDSEHATGVAQAMLRKMARTFAEQNEPLGIIDAGYPSQDATDAPNPLSLQGLMALAGGPGRVVHCKQTAYFTSVTKSNVRREPQPGVVHEEEAEDQLVWERGRPDYALHYTLQYYDQEVQPA